MAWFKSGSWFKSLVQIPARSFLFCVGGKHVTLDCALVVSTSFLGPVINLLILLSVYA